MSELDRPERLDDLRRRIRGKPALRALYHEIYQRYHDCLERCRPDGDVVELGAGGGFADEVIPEIVRTDVVPYADLDRVVDATAMPFEDGSVRAFFLCNVFHHIADAAAFLREAERCLGSGGRVLIVDQHPGWISMPILRFAHDEPFDARAREWRFDSSGPVSGANGALAWVVFQRDRERLADVAPSLRLESYRPHTPLRYWLAGGLKRWSLLPSWAFSPATRLDHLLAALSPQLGSFVDIELRKL